MQPLYITSEHGSRVCSGCRSPSLPRMWGMITTGRCLAWAGMPPTRHIWAPSPMSNLPIMLLSLFNEQSPSWYPLLPIEYSRYASSPALLLFCCSCSVLSSRRSLS